MMKRRQATHWIRLCECMFTPRWQFNAVGLCFGFMSRNMKIRWYCVAQTTCYCAAVVNVKRYNYRGDWCACAWILNVLLENFRTKYKQRTLTVSTFKRCVVYFFLLSLRKYNIWWPRNTMRDKQIHAKTVKDTSQLYRTCQIAWMWI